MSATLPDHAPLISQAPSLSVDQVAARLAEYQRDAAGALSENTHRAIASDTRIFADWCSAHGREFGPPADPVTVAAFVDDQASTKAPATVSRYVTSINHLHRAVGVYPVGHHQKVRLALKRLRRSKGVAQKQAAPMSWLAITAAIDGMGDTLIDLRDAALVALAFDTMLRASELVALNVGDVRPTGEGDATARVARSKTDQEGRGAHCYVSPFTLERVAAWVEASGLEQADPLFIPLSAVAVADPQDRLAAGDVSRIYKRRVGAEYSAHSTRVGAAVDQQAAGVPLGQTAQAGRWKSPAMVLRYTQAQQVRQGGAAALARLQGRG